MSFIELNSVGTAVDENGITHPINADGTYDLDEGVAVHLLDVDNEWFNSLSSDDLTHLFDFVANDLVGDLGDIDLGHWISTIHGEWHQVNVIDCTEGSNWTEPYGQEVEDDEMTILSQSQYSEVI